MTEEHRPAPPCEECYWEEVRTSRGAFVRYVLLEPCGDHYRPPEPRTPR